MKTNKQNKHKLDKARSNKNDEFYTTRENAIHFLREVKDDLNYKKVILPCDTEESEIYKVVKEKWPNAIITLSDVSKRSFLDINYNEYDYLITNPPFSLLSDFWSYIQNFNIKWLVFGNNLSIARKNLPFIGKTLYYSKVMAQTWKNTDKAVSIRYYSNFVDFNKPKLEFSEEKKYEMSDQGIPVINRIKDITYEDKILAPIGILDRDISDYYEILDFRFDSSVNGKWKFTRILLKKINK